jgi:predicted 3-demethylubiquinone-9 3-methyltransferase (glyoxalase superfamily)
MANNNGKVTASQKITPFLWFNDNGEEAIKFYCSVFKNSRIGNISRNGNDGPGPKGAMFTGTFYLEGQEFMALNGGPHFKFTEALSLFVKCDSQEEIDMFWETLSEGGQKSRCGWLKDKFGLSWQIVPNILGDLLNNKDVEKSKRAMQALMKMDKIDINVLKEA